LKFSRSPSDKHFVSEVGEPAQPLEIRVVNADELRAPDKVISIKRNDTTGGMTGAVVQSVP
jgi:hypothetical protein